MHEPIPFRNRGTVYRQTILILCSIASAQRHFTTHIPLKKKKKSQNKKINYLCFTQSAPDFSHVSCLRLGGPILSSIIHCTLILRYPKNISLHTRINYIYIDKEGGILFQANEISDQIMISIKSFPLTWCLRDCIFSLV